MKPDKLKDIPVNVKKTILNLDKNRIAPCNNTRFYVYLTKHNKDLVFVTVAVKDNRKKVTLMKQVAIHSIKDSSCYIKDMEYAYMGGFTVGWYNQKISTRKSYFEDGIWYSANNKYYFPSASIVNLEYLRYFKEFRYSSCEKFSYKLMLEYLRIYKEYPKVELLVKAGLSWLAINKRVVQTIYSNKELLSYIVKYKDIIKSKNINFNVIRYGFKRNMHVLDAFKYQSFISTLTHGNYLKDIRDVIPKSSYPKLFSYLDKQHISFANYLDYIRAIKELNLDLLDTKNIFPLDFRYWHDERIKERATLIALKDKKKTMELNKKIKSISRRFKSLQLSSNEYSTIIAASKNELVTEGTFLHHCVGSMSYDQRIINKESLIFFVRENSNLDIPFVTLEYSIKSKKILQCYGDHNSKPSKEVLEFLNNTWLPYVNKKIKNIKIA